MDTTVKSTSTKKSTIQLEVYYFTSSGKMNDFISSPECGEIGKKGPVLIFFNGRIYYMVDSEGPHSLPILASKLLVNIFGLSGLTDNSTTAKTVQYHDPNVEIIVNATYMK